MNQIKVGQIGKGSFGKKILSKLDNIENVSVEWVCSSQDKWWDFYYTDIDWVIIASPNEFHYEQAKHFLEKGINVFCEKPGTLCPKSLKELILLSKTNNVYFYIDDVLMYEDIKPINNFIYKKWGGSSANIIDRMAYHHFYLLHNEIGDSSSVKIKIVKNEINHKIFELNFDDRIYKFEYDFILYKQKIHNITPHYNGYALEKMLSHVLF